MFLSTSLEGCKAFEEVYLIIPDYLSGFMQQMYGKHEMDLPERDVNNQQQNISIIIYL